MLPGVAQLNRKLILKITRKCGDKDQRRKLFYLHKLSKQRMNSRVVRHQRERVVTASRPECQTAGE